MRVLIAQEFSGVVRDAFLARGHEAVSCDLRPTERPGPHHQGDVRPLLRERWDLIIAHPDCTYHTNASVRWFTTIPKKPKPGIYYGPARWQPWRAAVDWFNMYLELDHVPRVAIENPIMHKYSREAVRVPYTQIIQPWMFGHERLKATCLWLKGLPELQPTKVLTPPTDPAERRKWAEVHQERPGPERQKNRSRTYQGIAAAMAEQWGQLG